MSRWYTLVCFIIILIFNTQCAKILVVSPIPAYSHFSLGFRIAKELADRGHQVTVISPYPQTTPIKNYKDVSVEENIQFMEDLKKNLLKMNTVNPVQNLKRIFEIGNGLTELTFSNKNVQELLNSGQTFDLMIMSHFLNDAHIGFAQHFKVPSIVLSPIGACALNNYIFANPEPSSYVPNLLIGFTKDMNFWQRIANFLTNISSDLVRELFFLSSQRKLFNKYITKEVGLDDVLYNVSVMLTNSHVSVNDAVPHVPSIIEIGGFHLNPPKKLPQDLQTFLDDSKEGVILFSMGSNLKSRDLNPDVRDGILKAFSKIKEKVLWKFEEELDKLPKNVKIMKWIPQQDVLGHPNVKVFMSHGGLLSTIESVYHGVPIIGIPVYGDQKSNIAAAVSNGYAVSIPLPELSEEKLLWALNEILTNPKYRENVKRRSNLMNDQPLKPIDSAIYWIEYVIRHKGAPQLRTAGLDLKWYQRHMIDVIIFLTLVTILLFIIFYIIIKRILGLCFKKRKVQITKTKKNK